MIVGVVIDPNCDSDCLTRLNDSVFHWSERTINTIDITSTQDTQLTLVLSMCVLFLNMMLDLEDNLLQGSSFEDFMSDYNLLTKKASYTKM